MSDTDQTESSAAVGSVRARPEMVCIGETMLMFAPPPHELIEYAHEFRAYLGGAESNVAIGLTRLGVPAGWIGKLPDNALGHKVVNEMRALGVDTSAVVWSATGRMGTFFVEWGATPRPVSTIYDRANSTATTLSAGELDWDYIVGADWVALTGITPATSSLCRETTRGVAHRVRAAGKRVLVDLNYRALLWSPSEAREAYRELLPHASLIVGTEPDIALLLDQQLGQREALAEVLRRYPAEAVVMTTGEAGSVAFDGDYYDSHGYACQLVNRLGAGDAFVAGLLYGYTRWGLQEGLRYGSAMAALKLTIPQNIPLVDKAQVERLVRDDGLTMLR